jgi:segregation and condensation protein A
MSDLARPTYRLGDFEGPLDLLLHLIQKSQLNIYDIPIAQITEQYLQILRYASAVDLDSASEFYVMAATLLLIKSRMLLPGDATLDEDFEDPRRELVERLLEYQKFKRYSELMADREKENEWVLERKKAQHLLPFAEEALWHEVSVWDLLSTFSTIISSISSERIIDLYEEVSVNEKVTLIHELLDARESFLFTDLLVRHRSMLEAICAFLAILELVRLGRVRVFQNVLFGDIRIGRRVREGEETQGGT